MAAVQDLKVKKSPSVKENRKCSWCEETCDHVRIQHHLGAKRSKFQCSKCLKSTVRCRKPLCDTMSRAHRGWHEGFCIDHNPFYREMKIKGYCSWCFKESEHTIQNDSLLNRVSLQGKVFACDKCHRGTQHCKDCETGMCRIAEAGATPLCFKCAGLIHSWDDPEACHNAVACAAWCPWCVQQTTHEVYMHTKGKKDVEKDVFKCKNCSCDTKKCSSCRKMMVSNSNRKAKCLLCVGEKSITDLEAIHAKGKTLSAEYTLEMATVEMKAASPFRQKALDAGLLRPFELLVSMHPQMRAATAFKIDISLLHEEGWGNPHAEADLILFDKKRGLQHRTSSFFESVHIKTKCNWYMILRRATHDLTANESTFKSQKAKQTAEECSDPSSEVLNAMEMELLDHMARRHLMMLPEKLRLKASELYETDEVYAMFDELHQPGMEANAICVAFIAIAIHSGMEEGKLDMNIDQVRISSYIEYLQGYLQGTTSMGNKIHKAQFTGIQVAFFIARVIVVGSLVQAVSALVFPPIAPFVSAGLFTVGVGLFIAAFAFQPTREMACQATLMIVFQHFLLTTSGIELASAPGYASPSSQE